MLERFTERARRVIFFARYEASKCGDSFIRCVHLLAGLAREDKNLTVEAGISAELAKDLCLSPGLGSQGPPIDLSVEVPLDQGAEKALRLAQMCADRLGSRHVETVHFLWGVYHADPKLQARLVKTGLTEERLAQVSRKYSGREQEAEWPSEGLQGGGVRSGIGYDLHRLETGRKLVLGGVEVQFDRGPAGHSDGDALSHAICDALLGAAGLGDIGAHFPDTDPKWKGVSSLVFLEHARKLLDERGLRIVHIDAVVVAERPKLGPHFPAMREALARALGLRPEQINLKAKTNEGVDAIGRGEAIAAHAIATLEG